MKAGIFSRPTYSVIPLVAQGLTALGYQPIFQRPGVWSEHQAEDFNLVVILGTRLHSGQIRDLYQERGVPVLVIDLPPIRRDGLWAIWPYKINSVPIEAPSDRLGLVNFSSRDRGDDVLICGQKAGDAAHGLSREQLRAWFERTAALVKEKNPGKRIVWRPHPQQHMEMAGYDHSDSRSIPLGDALEGIGAVVTYNSTSGIDAILTGIPTFVSHTCYYKEAASGTGIPTMTERDALPPRDTLEDFFSRLTHCVWTEEELETPEPYEKTLARMGVKCRAA